MQAYNLDALKGDLENWMMNRFLEPILYIEGGWEYWIQIDFPAWLDVEKTTQYDFRREVMGVLQNARLDWLLNSQVNQTQPIPIKPIAVEIKAQTHKYLTSRFIQDVLGDVQKLSNLGENYTKLMLVAVIDNSSSDELIYNHNFKPITQYRDIVSFLGLMG